MASTAVQVMSMLDTKKKNAVRVNIIHTCGAASAVFTATTLNAAIMKVIKGMMLHKMSSNPGATAPTDNWDVTLVDENGIDMLGGEGTNMHTTTSQVRFPEKGTDAPGDVMVGTVLTPTIAGNSVNAAIVSLDLYFRRA